MQNGVPLFIDQLIRTLQIEQTSRPLDSRKISGPAGGGGLPSEVGTSAMQHGRELLNLGFSIDQVVHDYGDVCQAITDLAFERDAPIAVDEFRTLNRCLDNAIADAVTEFSYQQTFLEADRQATETLESQGVFAHELRNYLQTAKLAFAATKMGSLGLSGATGAVLERSLDGLGNLIDRSIDELRATTRRSADSTLFCVADFVAELAYAADLAAQVRGCVLRVRAIDSRLAIRGNRDELYAAVGNLLQNAFKFTHPRTEVSLDAYALADRILIDVKDHCGGLPAGNLEQMFVPFSQSHPDKTGLGLGLSIAKRSVEANDGVLSVRDVPGIGCVFTVSLPRYAVPP